MPGPSRRRAPAIDRSHAAVVEAATRLLVESPRASLAELAAGIGVGRTTLHRMFPTREALLAAVAHEALDHLEGAYVGAALTDDRAEDADLSRVHRLVELLIPLGPRLMFLLRLPDLDDDAEINARIEALDAPVRQVLDSLKRRGQLDDVLPSTWTIEVLYANVFVAWEAIDRGRLAAADAAGLVMQTWLHGVAHNPA